MSKRDEIQATLRNFIFSQFPAARKHGLAETDSLLELGVVDSMGVLEVVAFLESEFAITLTDDDLMSDHFESIASIADLVHHRLQESAL
ncbi:MAG: acyl carrier protein [Planctomycetaceae bacterium]|nr:acyl carrier protein [Planctomycetaceae bacterium]